MNRFTVDLPFDVKIICDQKKKKGNGNCVWGQYNPKLRHIKIQQVIIKYEIMSKIRSY